MKKQIVIFAFFLLFAVPVSAVSFFGGSEAQAPQTDQVKIRTQNGEELVFNVELAVTPQQQQQGLMFRTELADDAGMLFVFDKIAKRSFWMKDTYIPLDILFLTIDGQIHHIHHRARPQQETLITAELPSKAVLEIRGGQVGKLDIKKGDIVLHPIFNNIYE